MRLSIAKPYRLPLLLWTGLVLLLLWWPGAPEGLDLSGLPEGFDRLAHLVVFGPFGYLVDRAWGEGTGASRLAAVLAATVILGLVTEAGQAWVPGRSPEAGDLAADLAGAFLGWLGAGLGARGGSGRDRD